jgi:hypothetical protein
VLQNPGGALLRRTYGILLIATLTTGLACSPVYSQDREPTHEASFFTGWTFDVAPFYLWLPALDGTTTVRGSNWTSSTDFL